ncbi:tetratricopeptide repeat protein [Amycolatopsis sp. OK19-0408]|uniref:Tetratricopeptide repeat protein n=1 Tax=Amycolatopsis iheyensis TaxID=2945988 RepID=A0A9X2SP92_9PSEU|nr:BTAD domain-containing putative transcriptional regulator [Amycolatopsis iheyensis]MCR6489639.1 tetratricopeptide repeat protein [Amycolatopsis iheyensis]
MGILGPVEVWSGDRRLSSGGKRQQRLLAFLALNANHSLRPSQVIDALWDESPPSTARDQVYNTVAKLRGALGDARAAITSEGGSYRLVVAENDVDSLRFQQLVGQARKLAPADPRSAATLLDSALGLWRGNALTGLDGRAFTDAAAILDEEFLAAHELLIQLRLHLGATGGLAARVAGLVARHPVRETLVARQMAVLHHDGRAAEALQVYARTRILLADELGVDPGRELKAQYEHILEEIAESEVTEIPGERRYLPRVVADFTGRTKEIDQLIGLTREADGSAVVITALDGMPGIGKTTLAIRAGHLLSDQHPDGQLFLDLHGHTPGQSPTPASTALDALLRGVGVQPERIPEDLDRRADLWRASVASRRMLIVLDNAADAAQIRPLLPGTPGVQVIVTSRRRLAMLEGATSLSLDLLSADEAAELFRRIAEPGRPAMDADVVQEIISLCDRLPLAIRIAASRLRARPTWTPRFLAELLRDEDHRLGELAAGDRSVAAAFAVSYQHLGAAERAGFRLLGLMPGGDFDAHAAAAILGVPVIAAGRLLEDLVDANLLAQHAATRYHFHDLLRQYAHTTVLEECTAAERHAAIRRLLEHYLALGRAAERVLDPGRSGATPGEPGDPLLESAEEARGVVAAEHRNLVATLQVATKHAVPDIASDVAVTFGPLLVRRGYLAEALDVYERGLDMAKAHGDHRTEAVLHRNKGLALIAVRQLDAALHTLRIALALEEELGDELGAGRVHTNIGIAHIRKGHFREAIPTLLRATSLLTGGTPRDRAAPLLNLGVAHTGVEDYDAAIDCSREVLALTDLDNPYLEATALLNLGYALTERGDTDDSRWYLEQAGSLAHRIGATEVEARSLVFLAETFRAQGRIDDALRQGRTALALARDIGHRDVENRALTALGRIHAAAGTVEDARHCFIQALQLSTRDRSSYTDVLAHDGLARTSLSAGDHRSAATHWTTALSMARATDLPIADRIAAELGRLGDHQSPGGPGPSPRRSEV